MINLVVFDDVCICCACAQVGTFSCPLYVVPLVVYKARFLVLLATQLVPHNRVVSIPCCVSDLCLTIVYSRVVTGSDIQYSLVPTPESRVVTDCVGRRIWESVNTPRL